MVLLLGATEESLLCTFPGPPTCPQFLSGGQQLSGFPFLTCCRAKGVFLSRGAARQGLTTIGCGVTRDVFLSFKEAVPLSEDSLQCVPPSNASRSDEGPPCVPPPNFPPKQWLSPSAVSMQMERHSTGQRRGCSNSLMSVKREMRSLQVEAPSAGRSRRSQESVALFLWQSSHRASVDVPSKGRQASRSFQAGFWGPRSRL